MPAFKLSEYGGEEIVFAESINVYESIGYVILEESDESFDFDRSSVKPAPEFDKYESLGYVPAEVLIKLEWVLSCLECDRLSNCEEDDDYEGRSVVHSCNKDMYFCCPECANIFLEATKKRRAERADMGAKILKKFPGIHVDYILGGDGHNLVCWVKFPGGEGQICQEVGKQEQYITTANVDAWQVFAERSLLQPN